MKSYFELRNVAPSSYADYEVPRWLQAELAKLHKDVKILDFGCGFGQLIGSLQRSGFTAVEGADVDDAAIASCRSSGYVVHNLVADPKFYAVHRGSFDVIVSQHVLEHIPKDMVIGVVEKLRSLLVSGGVFLIAVPNAQAFTGAYWAYEDFTHHTLYTSGSIYYVIAAAGFDDIKFLDIDCTTGLSLLKRLFRRSIWVCYRRLYLTMCRVMASETHIASPDIFSYEIKVAAKFAGAQDGVIRSRH
jgi:SAM-dependent methyltransferase